MYRGGVRLALLGERVHAGICGRQAPKGKTCYLLCGCGGLWECCDWWPSGSQTLSCASVPVLQGRLNLVDDEKSHSTAALESKGHICVLSARGLDVPFICCVSGANNWHFASTAGFSVLISCLAHSPNCILELQPGLLSIVQNQSDVLDGSRCIFVLRRCWSAVVARHQQSKQAFAVGLVKSLECSNRCDSWPSHSHDTL